MCRYSIVKNLKLAECKKTNVFFHGYGFMIIYNVGLSAVKYKFSPMVPHLVPGILNDTWQSWYTSQWWFTKSIRLYIEILVE